MKHTKLAILTAVLSLPAAGAFAQSSSLYVTGNPLPAQPDIIGGPAPDRLSSAVAKVSLATVRMPEPKTFAQHDLITIIIREQTESGSDAKLTTKKESKYNGAIEAFPNLNLSDLLEFTLEPSEFPNGQPRLNLNFKSDFNGDAEATRSDKFTDRITARIIDIKPNGTMVLEARKFVRSDRESLEMVLSGTCRKEDITADNSILSTQLYDMHLVKNHKGEVRNTARKGLLTKIFDAIFAF